MKCSLKHCLGMAFAALATLILPVGCERDFSHAPSPADLLFSADTVSFDTIFAGYPTPTLRVALRNVGDDDVTVGSIALEGGESSAFMVNINGTSATRVENVRLCHGDSLLVFVAVRDASVAGGRAFRNLADRIVASNGAYEWNALVTATVRNVKTVKGLIETDEQWLCDTIPYLITDSVAVAEAATLLVGPGVSVLMDDDAFLDVLGRLVVAGDVRNRTSFASVRQDGIYSGVPGQWFGVLIEAGASADIRYCDVACAQYALACDSLTTLSADGLWIRDASRSGVYLYKADADISNTIVSDCGGGSFHITGGRTKLRHVTVADYYSWDYRKVAALRFDSSTDPTASLDVSNSIIIGNLSAEVEPDSLHAGVATVRSSLIRGDKKAINAATDVFIDCAIATDAHFADRDNRDYHVTSKSDAAGLADETLAPDLPTDFEGVLRETGKPWCAGALQTVAEQ